MRFLMKLTILVGFMCPAFAGVATPASALAPAARLALRLDGWPTEVSPTTGGTLLLRVTDEGARPVNGEPVTVTDALPPGLMVSRVLFAKASPAEEPLVCTHNETTVSCSYGGGLNGDGTAGLYVAIGVEAKPGMQGRLAGANVATVSSPGVSSASLETPVSVGSEEGHFGLDAPLGASVLDSTGASDTQAGDHPNIFTTEFVMNSATRPDLEPGHTGEFVTEPVENVKDVVVRLPPGFVVNQQAATTCPQAELAPPNNGMRCPLSSVVGSAAIEQGGQPRWSFSGPVGNSNDVVHPVFNVPPERGHPVEFGFLFKGQVIAFYTGLVHTAAGYVGEAIVPSAPRFVLLTGVKVTLFGDPATVNGSGTTHTAFFTNSSDCDGGPSSTQMYMDTWLTPALLPLNPDGSPNFNALNLSEPAWVPATSESPPVSGCNKLSFTPSIEATPTSKQTVAPSGLNVTLRIPQNEDPEGLATPPLKNATVTLPKGLTISPSSANGLAACSNEQFAEDTTEPATCPQASQVGTVMVHTPILANPVEGQVFVGAPECNPCSAADAQNGRMIRLFLQVHSDEYGLTLKFPGRVSLDPATGQLTATFQNLIQQPFDKLEFHFKSGERAPLSTPAACGSYASNVDLTPWSAPYTPDANLTPGFNITEGCGGQGFAPAFSAGTTSNQAGAYSPLTLTFSRSDTQQDFNALEATLPPGLLAKLAGVPRCGEAEANSGTCPEGSKIGTVTVGAGPGSEPYYVTGQIYLTGPYNGGPFGEVVEVPAVAGPFNLGVVAVRGSIRVNPSTIQATVVSNPFPSILDGIPLQVKTVNVLLNRESFIVNPTSCAAQAVTGKLTSTQGAAAGVSSPYAVTNCAALAFKPNLTATVSGRASKAGGAGFDVKVTYPAGPAGTYANTKSVKVDLPKQLPSRLTTLQKACLAATFEANPANCPAASDVGTATAVTPLLGVPVNGPAYLVSHGGEAFPDLEVVLQGEGVTAIVVFNTSIKKGITSSTLKAAPDVPLSSFELKLPTGKYSILGANLPPSANYSLCGQSLTMPTAITGQNGTPIKQNTKIAVTGCPKVKKASKKKAHKASKSTRRGH